MTAEAADQVVKVTVMTLDDFREKMKDNALEILETVANGKAAMSGDHVAIFDVNPVVVPVDKTMNIKYKLVETSYDAGFKIKNYFGTDMQSVSKVVVPASGSEDRAITVQAANDGVNCGLIIAKIEIEIPDESQVSGVQGKRKSRYFDPEIICSPDPL